MNEDQCVCLTLIQPVKSIWLRLPDFSFSLSSSSSSSSSLSKAFPRALQVFSVSWLYLSSLVSGSCHLRRLSSEDQWVFMRIETSGFTSVTCASLFLEPLEDEKPTARNGGEDDALPAKVTHDQCSTSSSTTSSIGRNSDLSSERSMGDEDCGESDAQSAYKGSFDMMDSLEEVLPVRRGISKFYNGKSKSFTSLVDASSSSCKEIAKPENVYSRKRRNLMAFNHVWDKNRNFPLRSNSGGITKRTISSSRSSLALVFAMNSTDSCSSLSEDSNSSSNSRSPPCLPPLHPRSRVSATSAGPSSPLQQNFSAWRSFSLADLQHCATAATMKMPNSCLRNDTA